ncbi:MAG TPA: hypothetical protein VFF70_07505, partial [Anaerolineae bacterium]|nr:hypothetical protein [Anaerolineae bacterium]
MLQSLDMRYNAAMNSLGRDDDFIRRIVLPLILVITLAVFVMVPVLAITWSQRPFIGAFIEQTGVTSQINGANWPARSLGLPGAAHILQIDGTAVQTAQ